SASCRRSRRACAFVWIWCSSEFGEPPLEGLFGRDEVPSRVAQHRPPEAVEPSDLGRDGLPGGSWGCELENVPADAVAVSLVSEPRVRAQNEALQARGPTVFANVAGDAFVRDLGDLADHPACVSAVEL